jgi:hypothetical protein
MSDTPERFSTVADSLSSSVAPSHLARIGAKECDRSLSGDDNDCWSLIKLTLLPAHLLMGPLTVGPENSVHRRKAGFRSKEGRILESGYAYRVAAIKGQIIGGEIGG